MKYKSGGWDFVIASSLFITAVLTRVPFVSRMIFEGDSARFAMALIEYDVAQMRPHPPGYVLYVALAKLMNLFVHDIRVSMISISILSSALTASLLYMFACKMYGRTNGLITALLLLSSPLYWYNGEMPLTYSLEGFLSVIFAYICYKVILEEGKWYSAAAILLGLATGVRQNIIIMLFPLWIYAIRKCTLRQIVLSIVIFGMTCLAWFAPMVALTGGLERYITAISAQFTTFVLHPAPYLFELLGRGSVFSEFMFYSFILGLAPMFYYVGRFFSIPSVVEDMRVRFLLVWTVPSVFFFIGVNVFNPGHVIVVLPPLFIYLAEAIKGISGDLEEGLKRALSNRALARTDVFRRFFTFKTYVICAVCLMIFVNSYVFIFRDTRISHSTIRKGDGRLAELVSLTRDNFNPDKTMILTFLYNTQAGFYLPDYRVYCPFPLMFSTSEVPIEAQNVYVSYHHETTPKTYWIRTDFKIEPIMVPRGIERIILWEEDIAKHYLNLDRPLKEIASDINGSKIYFFDIKSDEKIFYGYHYLTVS